MKNILEESFPNIKGYYYVCLDDEEKNIRSALPLFLVKSRILKKRIVSIPFASVCDIIVSTKEDYHALIKQAIKLSKETDSAYVELRTLQSALPESNELTCSLPCYKHHFLNLKLGIAQLRKGFHRTCIKQRINRAYKSKLDLKVGKDTSDLEEFYRMHVLSRKRLGLPSQPYRFFHAIWDFLHPLGYVRLLLAQKSGMPIGGLLLFLFNNRVSAEFSVSDNRYSNLSPNHMLLWEAIQFACNEGYEIFDFGRTHYRNVGLLAFKQRWGTETADCVYLYYPEAARLSNFKKNEDSWQYRLASRVCKMTPVFMQRAIGNFFYNQLG